MTRKRITGRELARRLHVSSQWISQRTRAVVPMDADDMEMIASALGISVFDLLADAARRTSGGDSGKGPIGVDIVGYSPTSSHRRPVLSLVPPLDEDYPAVGSGYRSSPADAPEHAGERADARDDRYPGFWNGAGPIAPASAGTVNDAHTA